MSAISVSAREEGAGGGAGCPHFFLQSYKTFFSSHNFNIIQILEKGYYLS